jgi:hypothetical protein
MHRNRDLIAISTVLQMTLRELKQVLSLLIACTLLGVGELALEAAAVVLKGKRCTSQSNQAVVASLALHQQRGHATRKLVQYIARDIGRHLVVAMADAGIIMVANINTTKSHRRRNMEATAAHFNSKTAEHVQHHSAHLPQIVFRLMHWWRLHQDRKLCQNFVLGMSFVLWMGPARQYMMRYTSSAMLSAREQLIM